MAVWVLESSSDTDITIRVAVHKQELDNTSRTVENILGCNIADGFVARNHLVTVCCVRCVLVNGSEDAGFHRGNITSIDCGGVDVGNGVVDV